MNCNAKYGTYQLFVHSALAPCPTPPRQKRESLQVLFQYWTRQQHEAVTCAGSYLQATSQQQPREYRENKPWHNLTFLVEAVGVVGFGDLPLPVLEGVDFAGVCE